MAPPMRDSTRQHLQQLATQRILVLDGAMGTMIQQLGLGEAEYRGQELSCHPRDLKGCNDLLSLTRPEAITAIHRGYLEAGADILSTNTFNANRISLADYGLADRVREINRAAVACGRRAIEAARRSDDRRPRFLAGSIGPTNRTASMSPNVNDPGYRAVDFDQLVEVYQEQVAALVEAGVDILLPNLLRHAEPQGVLIRHRQVILHEQGIRLPVMASVTITDRSGRTLSGQTLAAFWISISHADLFSVGINCALGPERMRAHVEELSAICPLPTSCHPNAGLPNEFGAYDETPEQMARVLGEFAANGWLNIVGGCCGTTPDHIRAIAAAVAGKPPRQASPGTPYSCYSGLEPLLLGPDSGFLMIGERTNVSGSRRFARLVREGNLEEAVSVARQQVDSGANVLDVNMDEAILDGWP